MPLNDQRGDAHFHQPSGQWRTGQSTVVALMDHQLRLDRQLAQCPDVARLHGEMPLVFNMESLYHRDAPLNTTIDERLLFSR